MPQKPAPKSILKYSFLLPVAFFIYWCFFLEGFIAFITMVILLSVIIPIIKFSYQQWKKEYVTGLLYRADNFENFVEYISENGDSAIAADNGEENLYLVTYNSNKAKIPYHKIISCELLENGVTVNSVNRASQAGNAAIGGLLFGGAGAVVGALSSQSISQQKVTSINLRIITQNEFCPTWVINFHNGSQWLEAGKQLNHANYWLGKVTSMIHRAQMESR